MRWVSKKQAKRNGECREFRRQLVATVGHCELCFHDPKRVRPGSVAWALSVHEIARGCHRMKALDKPYACLVVCYLCHSTRLDSRAEWPEARQLAMLRRSRPSDYSLEDYNALIGRGPNRITEDEVESYGSQRENF
jgi:hypothetical protein